MSYFSVITCPGCGQKVTLTPEQIIDKDDKLSYKCRRCRYEGVLENDFVFKHPTKKDLPLREAIANSKSSKGIVGKLTSWFTGS